MRVITAEDFDALCMMIKRRVPGFSVAYKEDKALIIVIIAKILFFNKGFMTGYITTLKSTVYWPSRAHVSANWDAAFKVLAHEYVHIHDDRCRPILFPLVYLLPQILAAPSLVLAPVLVVFAVIWGWAWLIPLALLVAAAPFPAPGRAWAERRGYAMTLAVTQWHSGSVSNALTAHVISKFTGWDYYKMDPGIGGLKWWAIGVLESIVSGRIIAGVDEANQPYREVHALMKERGLLA